MEHGTELMFHGCRFSNESDSDIKSLVKLSPTHYTDTQKNSVSTNQPKLSKSNHFLGKILKFDIISKIRDWPKILLKFHNYFSILSPNAQQFREFFFCIPVLSTSFITRK